MAQPLLRTPGFAVYLTCRFLLGLVIRSQVLAIGYHVYELTSDPIALGYVGIAVFLPMVGFGLFAGDVADRVNRAIVLAVGSSVLAASSVGLFMLAFSDIDALWPYFGLTALFGTGLAFVRPTFPPLVAQLVPPAQLTNAIAMGSGTSQMANVIGPAVVGFLLIGGPAVAYATMAAVTALAAVMWLRLIPHAAGDKSGHTGLSTIQRLTAGVRIVMRTPLILGAMSLDLFAVLLGSVVALLPVFARDVLMVGPADLGLLRAAPAVGAAIVAVILSRMAVRRHAGAIMLSGVAIFGISILVFGLSRSLPLSLAALCVSGAADMLSNILRNTTIQLSAPNAIRGRVSAVGQVFVSGANELGDFRAGLSAGLLGAVPAVMLGGVLTISVAALWSLIFPDLRKLDRLAELGEAARVATVAETDSEAAE